MNIAKGILLLGAVAVAGCTSVGSGQVHAQPVVEDQLLGCYAQDANGPATLQVLREAGVYYLQPLDPVARGDRWHLQPRAIPASNPATGDPPTRVDAMLVGVVGVIGIAKIGHPVTTHSEAPPSDFLFIAPQVGGPIYPHACP